MIHKKYFKIRPQSWLCPHCGEWHEFKGKELTKYKRENPLVLHCTKNAWRRSVKIFCNDDFANVELKSMCGNISYIENVEIQITELDNVSFYGFTNDNRSCEGCCNSKICNIYENGFIYPGSFNFRFFVKFAIKFR